MTTRLFDFVGGDHGRWQVTDMRAAIGEPLTPVSRIDVVAGSERVAARGADWTLSGVTSNERYVTRTEKTQLVAAQAGLDRPGASCAALIPIRKNAAWWALTQDERRQLLEEQSHHIQIGLRYLPAIARRLHHCRDLGSEQPFDFLTWFEFAPAHASDFDALLAELRATAEWIYIERECEIRLTRALV